MNKQQKEKFERWIEDHPDVWQTKTPEGIKPTPHFWWVQNCLGNIFGWDEEFGKYIKNIYNLHGY